MTKDEKEEVSSLKSKHHHLTSIFTSNTNSANSSTGFTFDRDSLLRRTTDNNNNSNNNINSTRFEDIKKRYASTKQNNNNEYSNKDSNATTKNPSKKINLFTALFKDSPSDVIASKRDLFFKPSNNIVAPPSTVNHTSSTHNNTSPSTVSTRSSINSTAQNSNHIQDSAGMPIITGSSKGTSSGGPTSYEYYAGDREKPLSSYLSNNTNNAKGPLSSHSNTANNRYNSTNSSSSTRDGINPLGTSTSIPTSSKISSLISKVHASATLNAITDEDSDDNCDHESAAAANTAVNSSATPPSNSFAAELAAKKRLILQQQSNHHQHQNSPLGGRNLSNSSPPPSILSASVTGSTGQTQNMNPSANNKISAFASSINSKNLINNTNEYSNYSNNSQNQNHTAHANANATGIYGHQQNYGGHTSNNNNTNNTNIYGQNNLIENLGVPSTIVDKCIGFANLPNQFYRRAVKRGFEFTLMVVGESGLGKSTLINSLFLTDIYSDDYPGPSQRVKKTVDVETSKQILNENGVQLTLTMVDTPGFGDSVNNSECWQKILVHIENKYQDYLKEESRINRKYIEDSRIHCCLYFIAPSGHGLKELDIEFMKKLHDKVNIMPLIAKADTMVPEEVQKFKRRILNEIRQHNINIYEFPSIEDPEENKRNKELKDKVPFAIMGSNTVYEVNNRRVRGRKYPWGIAEVENSEHCDFSALRDMLVRRHMQHMKDITANVLYENFRCYRLSGGHPDSVSDIDNSPLTQLIEERREYEDNLAKTEREMEQVFSAKVKEKQDKIRESEAELEKRYEQMKRNLDEQFRDLDDRRRNFEAERHAWENGIPLVGHPHIIPANPNNINNIQHTNNTSNGHMHSQHNGGGNNNEMLGRNESHSYLNGTGTHNSTNNLNNHNNNNNLMSSNSTLNSLASTNKKGTMPPQQYNDTAMKEMYDEKEKKKEKKRFF